MRQSNVIFATLLFAFIVYITIRGQLPAYLDLFRGKGSSGGTSAAVTPSSTTKGDTGNSIDTALAVYDKFSTMFG